MIDQTRAIAESLRLLAKVHRNVAIACCAVAACGVWFAAVAVSTTAAVVLAVLSVWLLIDAARQVVSLLNCLKAAKGIERALQRRDDAHRSIGGAHRVEDGGGS